MATGKKSKSRERFEKRSNGDFAQLPEDRRRCSTYDLSRWSRLLSVAKASRSKSITRLSNVGARSITPPAFLFYRHEQWRSDEFEFSRSIGRGARQQSLEG